ncbi:FHA domain-containing protein [Dechloromonas denitrificans]|uniref:FHA domain-containing protein n=1 Tax=Dechloromonas denitrificans TaxID=281362 RepID=UPI001CF8C19C|nr:FHA domain-containing protein [Dechloromonas denitrificans]UCV03249.1 FHA domain-containing protein [Dechloromonas denitrificans]
MAKLVLSLNGNLLNQYFIDQTTLSIGRDSGNDIVINDALLSREHARIVCFGEDHIVEDLGSSNGSSVNGCPLQRQILHHRDVIELGAHRLCYLNTRKSAEVDLERTMLIKALPQTGQPAAHAPAFVIPALRPARALWPEGRVKVLAGQGRHVIGECVGLDRVVTTFGIPGEQLAVISRRPLGYFLTHVEGARFPRVNQRAINGAPYALSDGDQIEVAGYRLHFRLGGLAERV